MNRKDYEFAKKAARTAYQQALLDAGGGGGGGLVPHSHSYDGSVIDGEDFTLTTTLAFMPLTSTSTMSLRVKKSLMPSKHKWKST